MSAQSKYRLVVSEGSSKGEEYALEGKTVGLGRDPKNQVVLGSPGVSLFHARINLGPDGCAITNLGSIEGVKLNGKSVDSASLSPGDMLQLGDVKLRFEPGGLSGKRAPAKKGGAAKKPAKQNLSFPLKPSFILLALLALLAAVIMANIRLLGVILNW